MSARASVHGASCGSCAPPATGFDAKTMGDWSVTGRRKRAADPIGPHLDRIAPGLHVSSVFGFLEWMPMYGGRTFLGAQLSRADLAWMYDHGIAYRIPISSKAITREMYIENKPFLAEHHRSGNSVILARRDVAEWIAEDFPLYEREQSVTKRTETAAELLEQLDLFDVVVPHPRLNDRLDELASIPDKSRVRLFADAGCLYTCKTMHCYAALSKFNREEPFPNKPFGWECAQFSPADSPWKEENPRWWDRTDWDPQIFADLGFTKFKTLGIIPPQVALRKAMNDGGIPEGVLPPIRF